MASRLTINTSGTSRDKRRFRKFAAGLYADDPCWIATSLFKLDIFLHRKDSFCREAFISPVTAEEDGTILAACLMLHHPGLPVMQMAFFEAVPDRQDAVSFLIDHARTLARQRGCTEITAGLNGHLAYGVGIQTGGWDRPAAFDSFCHKSWYTDYFRKAGFNESGLSTYVFDPRDIVRRYGKMSRAYRQFTFRPMDKKQWRQETGLFGELANRCLGDTRYYFNRPPEQLTELLHNIKPLIKPEYLIFVLKDDREVGFIFWHPDFNEIPRPGRVCSTAGFGLRCLLSRRQYRTVIVNAIGLLPPYRNTGASMGLFMTALGYAGPGYRQIASNFVWDCNEASRRFNLGIGGRVDKRYSVFSAAVS